jgi:hypothetical protein
MYRFLQDIPEWLKIATGFLTALGGVLATIFQRKKKMASQSNHAQSFAKKVKINLEVDKVINTFLVTVDNCVLVSIAEWKNGEEPKQFRVDRSTDFNTWSMWKEWQIPEDNLLRIQDVTLSEGICTFMPVQLKDSETRDWHESRGIKLIVSLRVGVDDVKNTSRVLYASFTDDALQTAEERRKMRVFVDQLYDIYKPHGWLAKKNYLK